MLADSPHNGEPPAKLDPPDVRRPKRVPECPRGDRRAGAGFLPRGYPLVNGVSVLLRTSATGATSSIGMPTTTSPLARYADDAADVSAAAPCEIAGGGQHSGEPRVGVAQELQIVGVLGQRQRRPTEVSAPVVSPDREPARQPGVIAPGICEARSPAARLCSDSTVESLCLGVRGLRQPARGPDTPPPWIARRGHPCRAESGSPTAALPPRPPGRR